DGAASDVRIGQTLLEAGDLLTPARVGLLASQGIPEIPVHRRPMVQIVTAGDELVDPGLPLMPGESYNSNAPMLLTAVARAGGVGAVTHVANASLCLTETLQHALAAADLLLVVGGASAETRGRIQQTLEQLGV